MFSILSKSIQLLTNNILDSYIIKYCMRLFFFCCIMLSSATLFNDFIVNKLGEEAFAISFLCYLVASSLIYYFWIECGYENTLIKYGRLSGLGLLREFKLALTINRYSITGFTAVLLVFSSLVGIISDKSDNNPIYFQYIYSFLLAFIVGFAFRFGVISWINKVELRRGFTDDFVLIILPTILVVSAYIDYSLFTRYLILGFAIGVIVHMLLLYFSNLYFVENRNGHIAVWDDSPERFMCDNKHTHLSKTLLLLRKGTRIAAFRTLVYLEKHKDDLCTSKVCDNSHREYYVNKCRAYLILKKFDKLISLCDKADNDGIISLRLVYLKSQALVFKGKYNDAIFIIEKMLNDLEMQSGDEKLHKSMKYFYVRLAEAYAIKCFLEGKKQHLNMAIGFLQNAIEIDSNCLMASTYYVYFLVLSETIEQLQFKKNYCRKQIIASLMELKKIKINSKDTSLVNNLEIMEVFSLLLADIGAHTVSRETIKKFKVDESFNSYVFANQGLMLESQNCLKDAMFNYLRAIIIEESSLDPLAPAIARGRYNILISK